MDFLKYQDTFGEELMNPNILGNYMVYCDI